MADMLDGLTRFGGLHCLLKSHVEMSTLSITLCRMNLNQLLMKKLDDMLMEPVIPIFLRFQVSLLVGLIFFGGPNLWITLYRINMRHLLGKFPSRK
jgi:hypothetical protein